MDRGAWKAMVHSVTKSWTQLKQLSMLTHAFDQCGPCSHNNGITQNLLQMQTLQHVPLLRPVELETPLVAPEIRILANPPNVDIS